MTVISYFHKRTFSEGVYFAFPCWNLGSTFVALSGVGIRSVISVAYSFELKFVRIVTLYSTFVLPCSTTVGITFKGRLTSRVHRYLEMTCTSNFSPDLLTESAETDVLHEFELAIWGDKCDTSIRVEFSQSNALVELAVV